MPRRRRQPAVSPLLHCAAFTACTQVLAGWCVVSLVQGSLACHWALDTARSMALACVRGVRRTRIASKISAHRCACTGQPHERNIFARILRGEAHADVIDDDGDLFSFHDKNPASTHHYLVIPKHFIRDASVLRPDEAELVERMERKARQLVKAAVGSDFVERELALGFHWPPFYSVSWLHMHAIYPRSAMVRRWKYLPVSFKPPRYVLDRLRAPPSTGIFSRAFR